MLGQRHPHSGATASAPSTTGPVPCGLLRAGAGLHDLPLLASLSAAGTVSLGLWCLIAFAAWLVAS
jgi:hypothetical protein